jgi:hypothetical protein
VRLLIVVHEVRPVGQRSGFETSLAEGFSICGGEVDELEKGFGKRSADLAEWHAFPLEHPYAGSFAVALCSDPSSKAGTVRGDGGNSKRHGFEGRVSPRLVERWEHAEIRSRQQVPVLVPNQRVGAV